jgi:hypothetical protein
MGAAFRQEVSTLWPRSAVMRFAASNRDAARRRRAAVDGARIFAQTALGVLDRATARRGSGLEIASLFAIGAADALGTGMRLDARSPRRVQLEMLRRLGCHGWLGALRARKRLTRDARAPEAAVLLAAGGSALRGWLRGVDPAPWLETLLRATTPPVRPTLAAGVVATSVRPG